MRNIPSLILIFLILSFESFSQNCNNEDFENGSLTNPVPSTIIVTTSNAVNGWNISSGINSGTVTSCNIYSCCPSTPNSAEVISTSSLSGIVDSNIGPSYPISSFYNNYSVYNPWLATWSPPLTSNSGGGSGDWFCKLNDDLPNSGVHRIKKVIAPVTSGNALLAFSILPVIQNSSHACCSQPSIKAWLRVGCGPITTLTSTPQLSIFSGTTCSSSVGGFIPCPANPSFSYKPWQIFYFDLSSFIGNCVEFELAVTDCALGDHAAYAYFDAQCAPYEFLTALYYSGTSPGVFKTCGLSSSPASVPSTMGPFLWNGPLGWPYNGATTNTVNLTLPGVYTVQCNPMGVTTPIIRTFTVVSTPPASATLTSSQSTACAGGNTIALTGSPSGGVYTGSFVTGNSFNPASAGNYSVSYTYTDSNGCSDTTTKNINVINCTGITNINFQNSNIELFPQPAKDIVTINLNYYFEKYIEVRIVDITGKEIEKRNLDVINNKTQLIISNIPNSIYFLQFKNNSGNVVVKKLVVSK